MKRTIPFLFLGTILAGLSGCATSALEKQVDKEAAAEPPRAMHGELAGKGMDAFRNSPALTETQRRKLSDLHARMMNDTFRIQEEISRLKGVLFDTIVTTPYNAAKAETIKDKLIKLNDKRMTNMFDALTEAEKILGYVSPAERRRQLLGEFMNERFMYDETKRQ